MWEEEEEEEEEEKDFARAHAACEGGRERVSLGGGVEAPFSNERTQAGSHGGHSFCASHVVVGGLV